MTLTKEDVEFVIKHGNKIDPHLRGIETKLAELGVSQKDRIELGEKVAELTKLAFELGKEFEFEQEYNYHTHAIISED